MIIKFIKFIKFIPVIVFLFSLLIFFFPLTRPGVITGHDVGYHFTRVQLFTEALTQGQFPVRWIEGPVEGLSHPLFEFYPPGFYYAAAVFQILGLSYVGASYVVLMLAAAVGWWGMYLLVKQITDNKQQITNNREQRTATEHSIAALASATLFLFTPYRLSQMYVRGAFGEFLATSLAPLVFLGMYNLYNRYNRYNFYKNYILLAFSVGAMLLSHQPTFIIFAPVLALWIFISWLKDQDNRKLFLALAGVGTGLLLVSFFLLPLLFEGRFIHSANLTGNYFDFRRHFADFSQLVYSAWGFGVSKKGLGDGMSFQVGILNWAVVAGAVGLLLYAMYNRYKNYKDYISVFFGLIVFLFGIFMAADWSLPVWERFSVLGFIQYPWRYLMVTTLATSFLAGIIFSLWKEWGKYGQLPYVLGFTAIAIVFNLKFIGPGVYLPRDEFNVKNIEKLATYNPPDNPYFGVEIGYMPVWTRRLAATPPPGKLSVALGNAEKAEIIKQTNTGLDVRLTNSWDATIQIATHYFPGWIAKVDGKETTPAFDNPDGFMQLSMPAGEHTVELKLTDTPVRVTGNYLTLGTALGLALFLILSRSQLWSKYFGARRAAS